MHRLLLFLVAAGMALVGGKSGFAQADQSIGAAGMTIPVKVVDGHIIIATTLHDRNGMTDAVSLELSLDNPSLLTLDGNQYGWLKLDSAAMRKGEPVFTRITFANGVTLAFPGPEIKAEEDAERSGIHDRITRLYSSQLGDRKLKGRLGTAFLQHYNVELDLPGEKLVLTTRSGLESTASSAVSAAAEGVATSDFSANFELKDGLLVLPVRVPSGQARMILGSSDYDTFIDAAAAAKMGSPAGDVSPVTLAGQGLLPLSRFVSFRPKERKKDGEALLLSGVNLLESFRIEIDWSGSQIKFFQEKEPSVPESDRDFFAVDQKGTADAYLGYLQAHPKSRLAPEAARKLADLRIGEWAVEPADMIQALQWLIDTSQPERRTENCMPYIARLAETPLQNETTINAALLALKYSRQATTVQDVYRLHRILGEQYLQMDNLQEAWKHFMSAGFVTLYREPEHTYRVALGLARVYEREQRYSRAYSRYKAALAAGAPIPTKTRDEINAALSRLREKIPAEDLKMLDS